MFQVLRPPGQRGDYPMFTFTMSRAPNAPESAIKSARLSESLIDRPERPHDATPNPPPISCSPQEDYVVLWSMSRHSESYTDLWCYSTFFGTSENNCRKIWLVDTSLGTTPRILHQSAFSPKKIVRSVKLCRLTEAWCLCLKTRLDEFMLNF